MLRFNRRRPVLLATCNFQSVKMKSQGFTCKELLSLQQFLHLFLSSDVKAERSMSL